GEGTRHVVEPVTGVVGRKQRLAVDVKVEEVTYSVRILRTVQTMVWHSPRLGCRHRRAIELAFQPRGEFINSLRRRSRPPGRRHDPPPTLPHAFSPPGPGPPEKIEIQGVEREPRRFQFLVVAADAVAGEKRSVVSGTGKRRCCLRDRDRRSQYPARCR